MTWLFSAEIKEIEMTPRSISCHSFYLGGVARLDYVVGEKEDGSPKSLVHPVREEKVLFLF